MNGGPEIKPPFRIAIIGGGIGGLTLAVTLTRLGLIDNSPSSSSSSSSSSNPPLPAPVDLSIDIYESASQLTQVGAGISLYHRGWEVLKDLGLAEGVGRCLSPGQKVPEPGCAYGLAFRFRKSDRAQGRHMFDLESPGGVTSIHRADMQTVLLQHISSSIRINLGHRLERYEEYYSPSTGRDNITLYFNNGTTTTCDFLVGADGIKSAVRRGLAERHPILPKGVGSSEPLWSGTYVYRSLIQSEVIRRAAPTHSALTAPMVYCGKRKHFGVYPILQGKALNVVGFVTRLEKENTMLLGPSISPSCREEVAREFSGWEEEVGQIIDHMESPSRWAIQVVGPLSQYAMGRVAILGDAAHAMTPHLGNGAGQAMEDAYVLGHLLCQALRSCAAGGSPDIEKVCTVYNDIRRPFGNFVQEGSRRQGMLYEFCTSEFEDVQEGQDVSGDRLDRLARDVRRGWEWVWSTSPRTQVNEAVQRFDDGLIM